MDIPISPPDISSINLSRTKLETRQDPKLQGLIDTITHGWPHTKTDLPCQLWPFWTFRDELSVQEGIIFKGQQILVLSTLRRAILDKIHVAHLGAESNIRMCKDFLFWPGIKSDIRDMCHSCSKCAQFGKQNPKEPMLSQPIPSRPWQYVSQDIASFDSGTYLITVDHFSDFIEVDELSNTLASTIVSKTEAHIARYGVFDVLLTDNGPQFIASEFEGMCNRYGTQHITSSPYWPQGNGKAEASVKIIKNIMKKAGLKNLYEALLNHRNTPPAGHDLSPAQRCMGRRTQLPLPLTGRHLLASVSPRQMASVPSAISNKRLAAKSQYDRRNRANLAPILPGAYVYAKPPPHRKAGPWDYGRVTGHPTPNSFIIDTPRGVTRRNRVHLRLAAPPPPNALKQARPLVEFPFPSTDSGPNLTPPDVPAECPPPDNFPGRSAPSRSTNGATADVQQSPASPKPAEAAVKTRSGRTIKPPSKLDL